MNRRCAGLLLLAACGPAAAPPAPPLSSDDFTLGGVPADTDSAEIRLAFGEPDSVSSSDNPFDSGSPLVAWHYDGFEVRFAGGSTPVGYMILAPGERTARGLAVGDAASLALRLYGPPDAQTDAGWTYVDTRDESGLRVIDVVVRTDTVRRIYIGRAVD